jgi:hypothetical protein
VILYVGRLDLLREPEPEVSAGRARVMELEKVCSRMKAQMTKMKTTRPKRGIICTTRSLPWMCY